MPPPAVPSGVVGTDGRYPVVDIEPLWRLWNVFQLWRGEQGEARYVPKVNDWAVDPETGDTWVVDDIDPITLVPSLRPIWFNKYSGNFSSTERLVSIGPGIPSETYRVYVNDEVMPHTLSVDTCLHVHGTMSSYCKIFKGVDSSDATGNVISKVYDNSGNFIGTSVPLELCAIESHTNYATKCVKRCHCTETLVNGEILTIVIYSDDGHVVYKRQLLVEVTNTIADMHTSLKYINEISLESIWLSNMSTDLIEYPLNIPMNSLNMIGVVHYSDGSTTRYPVDGRKFNMLGMNGRLSSIIGHPADLTLRYLLSDGETAYASTGTNNRYITKPYRIVTVNPNNSIAVKLYGYPEWKGVGLGYYMRWFLLNLERNVYFDVTRHVQYASNTGAYDPKLYGYVQRKAVSVNLRDVSPSFIPFVHTQVVDITLRSPFGDTNTASWLVKTEPNDTLEPYGEDVRAIYRSSVLGERVYLKWSHQTLDDWLEHYYWRTRPQYDVVMETRAPAPTHFAITAGVREYVFSIDDWNKELDIGTQFHVGSTLFIRFIRRSPSGDLSLSYGAVIVTSA